MTEAARLADELQLAADDPMWAYHAEVNKGLLRLAAAALRRTPSPALTEGVARIIESAAHTVSRVRIYEDRMRVARAVANSIILSLGSPVPSEAQSELASSEPLGPLYDGATMDNQQLDGTTRRNRPVVTAGETAPVPSVSAEEAYAAYCAKAKELHGEFSRVA